MNEALAMLLEAYAPTYIDVLPTAIDHGITYTLISEADDAHESGGPLGERSSFMIRVFQKTHSKTEITNICAALRAAGWGVGPRSCIRDEQNDYYQYNFTTTKWGVTP